MRILKIVPKGWPCTLQECPPGHFVYEDQLCFKSEYSKNGNAGGIEAFNSAGEYFCAGENTVVQPADYEWWEE